MPSIANFLFFMNTDILNLQQKDPFADIGASSDGALSLDGYLHIRISSETAEKP